MPEDHGSIDDLLRSPLDEPDEPRRRTLVSWQFVAALVAGALVVMAGYAVAASGPVEGTAEPDTTTTLQTTTTTVDLATIPYPPGYEPITDLLAAKPQYALLVDDTLFVAVATASRRGLEPGSASFTGGSWILETADGGEISSHDVTFDADVSGVFSVAFPLPQGAVPVRLRLTERWIPDERDGSIELPLPGVPFTLDEPLVLDLGGDALLHITGLDLDEGGATVDWTLDGSRDASRLDLNVVLRRDGTDIVTYFTTAFFSQEPGPGAAGNQGSVSLERGFGGDTGDADTVWVGASVRLRMAIPADVEFDVEGLPIVTR